MVLKFVFLNFFDDDQYRALFMCENYEFPRYVLHLGAVLEPIVLVIPTVT